MLAPDQLEDFGRQCDWTPDSVFTQHIILVQLTQKYGSEFGYMYIACTPRIQNQQADSSGDIWDHPLIQTPTCQARVSQTVQGLPAGLARLDPELILVRVFRGEDRGTDGVIRSIDWQSNGQMCLAD